MVNEITGSYYDQLVAKKKAEEQRQQKKQQEKTVKSMETMNRAIRDIVNNESIREMIARWKSQNFKKEGQ